MITRWCFEVQATFFVRSLSSQLTLLFPRNTSRSVLLYHSGRQVAYIKSLSIFFLFLFLFYICRKRDKMLFHTAALVVLLALVQLAVCAQDYYKVQQFPYAHKHADSNSCAGSRCRQASREEGIKASISSIVEEVPSRQESVCPSIHPLLDF